ncbi:two-component regulator propeller domain-containing protein [Saccharicrinis sp. FJH54]|uniref:hybrid sensor histidine kinase/response regulator transcription factor n=1 Tax=Saccharicrinis sp. FJH54 TaxID=3344665 RepID=UPI0035D45381
MRAKTIKSYHTYLVFLLSALNIFISRATTGSTELSFDIYSQENGLPNNQIQCIYQDKQGWIWIGTSQGISRFDGYTFKNFLPDPSGKDRLSGNIVRVIREDNSGNLYIGTEAGGLNIFDREKETFSQPFKNYSDLKYKEVSVNDIEVDEKGGLWLGTNYNLMYLDTIGQLTVLNPKIINAENTATTNYIRNLELDKNGKLWIGTSNGLFTYNEAKNEMTAFQLPYGEEQNHEIWEIFRDEDGTMWIGTYSSGLFIINPDTRSINAVRLPSDVERSETVKTVSKGTFGEYWIGTRGGLFSYTTGKGVTGYYRHNTHNMRSLSNTSVLCVYHDRNGETWIGTRGGLNLLARSKQVFMNFGSLPGNNNFLNSSIVYAFWIDKQGKIWIGTEDGGINIYNPESGKYEYLMADPRQNNSISQNCIKAFLDDQKGHLWVATFLGGVDVINLKTGRITNYKSNPDVNGALSDNRVWDLCMDKQGDIWIATSKGLDKFVPSTGSFKHYPQINGHESISWIDMDSRGLLWMGSIDELIIFNPKNNRIIRYFEHARSMFEDSEHRIWIATNDRGIAIYSAQNGPIRYFDENDGLSNNQALCILEDGNKNLWISTTNGLSKFNPSTEIFRNFTNKDGLSNNQFCYGAACKTRDGELLFGSISGFNMFNPEKIISEKDNYPVVLTDFKIFNKSVSISEDENAVLTKSISTTDHITLNYDQNFFTIEFAALNFVNSEKNLYTYKLENFNKDWVEPSTARSATYTNLNPGDYVLHIKRYIRGSQSNQNELLLNISVLPPFWKTRWFLGLLFLAIAGMMYLLFRFFINREKIKNQLVIERVNARKLHELDMLKLKFFTNISHEIRTPLTLILGPVEKIMNNKLKESEISENIRLVHRNAKNLDRLINQLLDFRKLQTGNLKLNLTEADIVRFVQNIVQSFNSLAEEKQIRLKFTTLKKSLFTAFDPDKIEKILNNLLSNAFKFTEQGGTISVNLSLIFDSEEEFNSEDKEKQYIEISVKDTGKGITNKNINKIFMRFFQSNDGEDSNSGTGIGLALVKELVNLHKGKIFVSSKTGKGTKFTFRIPYVQNLSYKTADSDLSNEDQDEEHSAQSMETGVKTEDILSRIMLVVEDNADVRKFISSHFNSQYNIIEARNGKDGYEKAIENIPDIIVSDIIMPQMDGYELCKKIKTDERTSHIPVLLLTAMHSKEHELKGLTLGADDYITKPFDINVLQAKVENMLSIRESLREKYTETIVLEPTNIELSSPDERFLQKAIKIVEENISDSDLDIEKFSEQVGVSRMQLYRKLNALTNMTVKEFIRHIRLKRASQLLIQQKLNVSEIAYEVGFKDLSHFRKCFKREFGMSATEFISKNKQSNVKN